MRNTYKLRNKQGWADAARRIEQAVDALVKELEAHREYGATSADTLEAVTKQVRNVWHREFSRKFDN